MAGNPQCPRNIRHAKISKAPKKIQLLLCADLVLGRNPGPGGVSLHSANFHGMVSRRHASIKYLSGTCQWIIKDLNSTNGVHVNGEQIPSNEATPINHGDIIKIGLNTEQNDLSYTFINNGKDPTFLNRCEVKRQRPIKRQRSPDQRKPEALLCEEDPIGKVPTPKVGVATETKGPVNGTKDSTRLSSTPPLIPSPAQSTKETPDIPPCNQPVTSTPNMSAIWSGSSTPSSEEVLGAPPSKKAFTLDSLFDMSKSDTTTEMEDAIFGKTPTLTPRARAVLMGVNVSPIEIQVQIARDEVEKEKNTLESKYQVLKSELDTKNRQLQERKEKEAKVSVAVEQEFICAICQELFIRSLTLPCSHSFCEWCFKQWKRKRGVPECPVCRTIIHQQPVRSIAIDNVIKRHVSNMTRKQQSSRRRVERQHMAALGLAPLPLSQEDSSSSGQSSLGSQSEPILVGSPERVTVISDNEDTESQA